MKIKILTPEMNFNMPVPLSMGSVAIRAIPESVFRQWRQDAKGPYAYLISRENMLILWEACKEEFKKCKGLEIIHVEAQDGTFVSIIV